MPINLHILKASGRLEPHEALIRSTISMVMPEIEQCINVPAVDVVIDDDAEQAIPETGLGGSAPSAHILYMHIDPDFNFLEGALAFEIRSTLAHELHHCARWKEVGYGTTLLEALVSEGLADHFDIEINGGAPKPWSVAFNGTELSGIYKLAEKEFGNNSYDHDAWFFGKSDIPRWAGYSLGYMIVGDYCTKYNKKASELVKLTAEKFLQ